MLLLVSAAGSSASAEDHPSRIIKRLGLTVEFSAARDLISEQLAHHAGWVAGAEMKGRVGRRGAWRRPSSLGALHCR
jgi:hypothetical protein